MKRRRWRRIAMWAGLAACGTFALLAVVSYWYEIIILVTDSAALPRGASLLVVHGRMEFVCDWSGSRNRFTWVLQTLNSVMDRWYLIQPATGSGPGFHPPMPRLELESHGMMCGIPLWVHFIIVAIPTFFLFLVELRDRNRRLAAGACGACGYDLTGNVTGRCPECGAAAEPAAGSKLPS